MRRHPGPTPLALALLLSSVTAAPVARAADEGSAATPSHLTEAPAPRPRHPMMAEIATALAEARQRVDALGRRAKSVSPAEALVLQYEAERVKLDSELAVLRIQAAWAKREGRVEVVRALEAAIEARLHPAPIGDPNAAAIRRAEDK